MKRQFESIADGLADDGLAVVDDFLSLQEVNEILGEPLFESRTSMKKAGIGKDHQLQINESIRGDHILWLDKTSAPLSVMKYLNRLEELYHFLNQSLFLSLKDSEIHFTSYPPGTFYRRHLDQFRKDDHRILSVICYLNYNWKESDGGQLRIYRESGSADILPTAGRLVCFRSDQLEHEVLPANRERLSLTGWILDQLADVRI
jgi:SM-20-related protein